MSDLEPFLGPSTAGTLIKSSSLTGISQPVNERRGNYVGPFLGGRGARLRKEVKMWRFRRWLEIISDDLDSYEPHLSCSTLSPTVL